MQEHLIPYHMTQDQCIRLICRVNFLLMFRINHLISKDEIANQFSPSGEHRYFVVQYPICSTVPCPTVLPNNNSEVGGTKRFPVMIFFTPK